MTKFSKVSKPTSLIEPPCKHNIKTYLIDSAWYQTRHATFLSEDMWERRTKTWSCLDSRKCNFTYRYNQNACEVSYLPQSSDLFPTILHVTFEFSFLREWGWCLVVNFISLFFIFRILRYIKRVKYDFLTDLLKIK